VGRRKPDENVTFRLDPDVVTWARVRALLEGTSLNRAVARLLEEYARIPQWWLEGEPPPWPFDDDHGRERSRGAEG
jgi:hypothetical protein